MSMKDIIGDFQAFFALQLGRLNDVDIIEFLAPTFRPLLSSPVARDWWKKMGPHSTTPSLYRKISGIMAKWDNAPTTE